MSSRTMHGGAVRRQALLLRSPRLRPLRFALTGGVAGLVQLSVLSCLLGIGVMPLPSNGLAFVLAAQVNFLLSQTFTWADRQPQPEVGRTLWRRWVRFHASITATAMFNMAVFVTARAVAPDLFAAALGIGITSVANYVLGDRVVFRHAVRRSRKVQLCPGRTGTPGAQRR